MRVEHKFVTLNLVDTQFGIDCLPDHQAALKGRRVGVVAHAASYNLKGQHLVDLVASMRDVQLTVAFGPQHGLRGEKQENMIESHDYTDPVHKIPILSLYSHRRRPQLEHLKNLDVLLFDLQDIGCRIYTYLSTLVYLMHDCAQAGCELWVLDRPNPAGRPIEGLMLQNNFFSFVGLVPTVMRHGLSLGELALWYKQLKNLPLNLQIIKMQGYTPEQGPYYGWCDRVWLNPSPNIPRLTACRAFSGTVLLEGSTLSEGRGSTLPLELIGAPDIDSSLILKKMHSLQADYLQGCWLRPCFFEPVFHKHAGLLCNALQVHTDNSVYKVRQFKAFRLVALYLKAIRLLYPDYNLWRQPPYEYEATKMPIDILSGSDFLRLWVDDPQAQVADLEHKLNTDESTWQPVFKEAQLYSPY